MKQEGHETRGADLTLLFALVRLLKSATSALDSGNEASLYARLRESGTTLISIAHRAAVLRHHTHVLRLSGEGGWEMHEASTYQFVEDEPVAKSPISEADAQPA